MTISENDYQEILAELGYPIVAEDELEFSPEQIKSYFIFPALREFFTWFPIKETDSQKVSGFFSIPFPDEFTYGVSDVRVATGHSLGRTDSPFMNEVLLKEKRGSMNMYGTRYDYGMKEASYLDRSLKQAQTNYSRVKRLDVDEYEKKVSGYSNIEGELIVVWAKYSDNFSDVPMRRKSEVINLAKSKVLKGFAMVRGQFNSDINVEFNSDVFDRRADDLEEKTLNKWKSMTKVSIIRN